MTESLCLSCVHLLVDLAVPLGEAPLLGDVDLLAPWELELGPPERLDDGVLVLVVRAHRHQRLTDPHARNGTLRLPERATHPGLETIGACARQHFVDAEHVEGVHADPDVELVLGRVLHHVLVAADPARLEGLGGELLQLAGHQVHAQRELIDARLLPAEVEDADLGVGDAPAEARLWVRFVLAVPVASRGTATHPEGWNWVAYSRKEGE